MSWGRTLSQRRRRAAIVTAVVTLLSLGLLVDLFLVNHTTGEEIWGPITASAALAVGFFSLVYLVADGRSRGIKFALLAFWAAVAFLGYGGYNDHRLPRPADTITDQRPRPPLSPLAFTALGIVGGAALFLGSRDKKSTA
jgi:hypothetical protein